MSFARLRIAKVGQAAVGTLLLGVTPLPACDGQVPAPAVPHRCQVGDIQIPLDITAAEQPSLLAPTSFYDANKRLYRPWPGGDVGASKNINRDNIAVITGQVLDTEGQPLPCVQLTVLDRPYDPVVSRADGQFAMTVAGDDEIVVKYQADGYFPAQRRLAAPALQYSVLPPVSLLRLSSESTPVDFDRLITATEVAEVVGAPVNEVDPSGVLTPRRARLFFLPGTRACLQQKSVDRCVPTAQLNILTAEYTVGERGPATMPATLPPPSQYNYAAEYTAEEALQQGAESIVFSPPVISYVENFTRMPVGAIVPLGSYSRRTGQWDAVDNGRVIQVLGVENDEAVLRTTSRTEPTSRAELLNGPLQFTAAELHRLAQVYTPGTTLWRTRLPHFSTYDQSWPSAPPPDAELPPAIEPSEGTISSGFCTPAANPSSEALTVDCGAQLFNYKIPVPLDAAGSTNLFLHYQQSLVPGYLRGLETQVQVTGEAVPKSLRRISVQMEVLGHSSGAINVPQGRQPDGALYPANKGVAFPFSLTNLPLADLLGRTWQGGLPAVVQVNYYYKPYVYETFDDTVRQFGKFSGQLSSTDWNRGEVVLMRRSRPFNLNVYAAPMRSIFGFDINVHHSYSRDRDLLYRGDGTVVSVHGVLPFVAQNVASNLKVAALATIDSTLFIADGEKCRIYYRDGTLPPAPLIGKECNINTGVSSFEQAQIGKPVALSTDNNQNLFIASAESGGETSRIYIAHPFARLKEVALFAGTGNVPDPRMPSYINRPPTDIPLGRVAALASAISLNNATGQVLYVAENRDGAAQLRVIEFHTQGNRNNDPTSWTDASSTVLLTMPGAQVTGLAVAQEPGRHKLFIADSKKNQVFQVLVAPNGKITGPEPLAGGGDQDEDNLQAWKVKLSAPTGLAYWSNQAVTRQYLYIVDAGNQLVRRVDLRSLRVSTVTSHAGAGGSNPCGADPQLASTRLLRNPRSLAIDKTIGNLYVAETDNAAVCKLTLAKTAGTDVGMAADFDIVPEPENPTLFYVFNAPGNIPGRPAGAHVKTVEGPNFGAAVDKFIFSYEGDRLQRLVQQDGRAIDFFLDRSHPRSECDGATACIITPGGGRIKIDTIDIANKATPSAPMSAMAQRIYSVIGGKADNWEIAYLPDRGGLANKFEHQRDGVRLHTFKFEFNETWGGLTSYFYNIVNPTDHTKDTGDHTVAVH